MKTIQHTRLLSWPVGLTLLLALFPVFPVAQAGPHSGVDGQVFLEFPIFRSNFDGTPLGGPVGLQTTILVYSARTRQIVTRVRSDLEGRFQVALSPGTYYVTADVIWLGSPGPFTPRWLPTPVEVTIQGRGDLIAVRLSYEYGTDY